MTFYRGFLLVGCALGILGTGFRGTGFGFSSEAYARDTQSVAPVQKSQYLDIQKVTSAQGLTAWLVEDHSVPVIAVSFSFKDAGSKNDTAERQGLARLLSNTMDEGAGELDSQAFQKMMRDKSISLGFSSGRDHFHGHLKTLTRNKDVAFHLMATALNAPRFDSESVERMRASNLSRIKSSISNPRWIAARLQNDLIFKGHPYAHNSGGTLRSMAAISVDDLKAAHKTLGKNQLIIAVAGDISADELRLKLDELFNNLPDVSTHTGQDFALKNAGKTYVYEKDIPQTVIAITQTGVSRSADDYYAAKVMNFILGESGFGSRLMEEIREKRGLTYGIYSYFQDYGDSDTLHISTSTANDNVKDVLLLIESEWATMKTENVGQEELDDAKSYLIGSLPLSLTSTDSIASVLISMQLDGLPIDYLDKRGDKIRSVGIKDIKDVSQKHLNSANFTTILVGHPGEIEGAISLDTLPNVE